MGVFNSPEFTEPIVPVVFFVGYPQIWYGIKRNIYMSILDFVGGGN